MDRIRSFFDDLRLFDDYHNDDDNNTDTDKSSIDTNKSTDIEEEIFLATATTNSTNAAAARTRDVATTSFPIDSRSLSSSVSPSVVVPSPTATASSRRSGSSVMTKATRYPFQHQRSIKSTSTLSNSIRNFSNSMVEDDDDHDQADDGEERAENDINRDVSNSVEQGKARSFTRFQFRSRSNMESMTASKTEPFGLTSSISSPNQKRSNSNSNSNSSNNTDINNSWNTRKRNAYTTENDAENGISSKAAVPDDAALDDTPANLFGYACGVEFCTSMELMNKIQGTHLYDDDDDDDEDDEDDDDDDDGIMDDGNDTKIDDDNHHQVPPTAIGKRQSRRMKKNAMKAMEKNSTTKTCMKDIDTGATVATQKTIDSSSDGTQSKKTHLRRWGHGKVWTITSLLLAYIGCTCAILTRQSVHFVTLRQPLRITDLYEPIYYMGMIRVRICTNATAAHLMTPTYLSEQDVAINSTSETTTTTTNTSTTMMQSSDDCTTIRFTREEVNDRLFNLSRSLLTMGSFLGIALTIVLTTSVVWETINLRPIAFGFLVAYFFQSFSMLFFDTELCHEYSCQMSTGGYLSIIASICWIAVLICVVRMDLYKLQSIRFRRRAERKVQREARQQERKAVMLRKRQQREQMMIIDNFQRNNTMSVDVLDIEAVLSSEAEYRQAAVDEDKKIMAL